MSFPDAGLYWLGIVATGSVRVLGQASGSPDWLMGVRDLGSLGIVAFIVWFVCAKAWPRMNAERREERKEDRDAFLDAIAEQRRDFAQAMHHKGEALVDFKKALDRLTEVVVEHDRAMKLAHAAETRDLVASLLADALRNQKGQDE